MDQLSRMKQTRFILFLNSSVKMQTTYSTTVQHDWIGKWKRKKTKPPVTFLQISECYCRVWLFKFHPYVVCMSLNVHSLMSQSISLRSEWITVPEQRPKYAVKSSKSQVSEPLNLLSFRYTVPRGQAHDE